MIDVSPHSLELIQKILNKHVPDCEVRAFGSRVTWTAKDYSDLDLAVVGKEKLAQKTLSAIKDDFKESDLPIRVDVLDWNAISKEFRKVIEKNYEVVQKIKGNKQTEISGIPEGWDRKAVKEIGRVVTGKTPPTKESKYFGRDYPLIRIPDMGDSVRIENAEMMLSLEGAQYMRSLRLPPNSVMVSCLATIGKVGITVKDSFTNQQINSIIPDLNVVISEWIYYYFKNSTEYLENLGGGGSVYTNISKSRFENAEIILPPIPEQCAIAKILSDLDAKIELNHRMNKTLEQIAWAIFKRWFVDFEFPGYEKTKFVNGIPEDWDEGNLVEVCDITMGQSPPGETYNESGEGIVFYQGNRDFGFRFPTPRVYCTAPTRIAEAGDVLISVRAPVGALNITLGQCAIGRGVAALRMKNYSNGFLLYFLLTQNNLWDRYNSEGTVFGCLNKTEFHKMEVVIPSDQIMAQFDRVIMPIEAMIWHNEEENRSLIQIRDSLLPRLMSGKIRVNK